MENGNLKNKREEVMSKIGSYEPPAKKFKNFLQPTTKPVKSHAVYQQKVWTLQEQIYKKLRTIAEYLVLLYPQLSDQFSESVKGVIQINIEKLMEDLDLLQANLLKNPAAFNTKKLKTNQNCINEMKGVCDTLQTVRSYEHESKSLGKIKHTLSELEHLIQPSKLEKSLTKAAASAKKPTKPKAKPAAKKPTTAKPKAKAKPAAKKPATAKAKPARSSKK